MGKKPGWFIIIFYLLVIIGLYHKVLAEMVWDWWDNPDYSHGFLVIPAACYLIWTKLRHSNPIEFKGNWSGVAVVLAAAGLYYLGVVCSLEYATRLSLVLWIYGSIIVIFGFPLLRTILFPMLFLLFMIPLPYILYEWIAFPLRIWASTISASLLNTMGFPAYQEGNVIFLPSMVMDVVDACSGIRSMVSLLALASLVTYVSNRNNYIRPLVVLSAIPIAVFTNSLRIIFTGIFVGMGYRSFAEGFFHIFSGWLIFISGLLLILSVSRFGLMVENRVTPCAGTQRA